MNFLLYMIGRAAAPDAQADNLRPTPRRSLLRSAAAHAAAGRLERAVAIYSQLTESAAHPDAHAHSLDTLIRAQLHLALGQFGPARQCYALATSAILEPGSCWLSGIHSDAPPASGPLEALLQAAQRQLRQTHFTRAIQLLCRTRALLDLLLSAEAGQLVAAAAAEHEKSTRGLRALGHLHDLTLHMLARAHLARSFARSLQQKHLREDLASWAATPRSVSDLLQSEYSRLSHAAQRSPANAEIAYRLALVARATDHPDQGVASLRRVLALHPYHVPAAALLTLDRDTFDLALLRSAIHVPAPVLATFNAFAQVITSPDPLHFDRLTEQFLRCAPSSSAPHLRANLAFALSQLGLLPDHLTPWRETAAA